MAAATTTAVRAWYANRRSGSGPGRTHGLRQRRMVGRRGPYARGSVGRPGGRGPPRPGPRSDAGRGRLLRTRWRHRWTVCRPQPGRADHRRGPARPGTRLAIVAARPVRAGRWGRRGRAPPAAGRRRRGCRRLHGSRAPRRRPGRPPAGVRPGAASRRRTGNERRARRPLLPRVAPPHAGGQLLAGPRGVRGRAGTRGTAPRRSSATSPRSPGSRSGTGWNGPRPGPGTPTGSERVARRTRCPRMSSSGRSSRDAPGGLRRAHFPRPGGGTAGGVPLPLPGAGVSRRRRVPGPGRRGGGPGRRCDVEQPAAGRRRPRAARGGRGTSPAQQVRGRPSAHRRDAPAAPGGGDRGRT